ncbi:protein ALP1-like [Solenopsis invicta]|uniref:protein ALP1-like n=1 Tax=Solenopsis invicta TaxID=13686 RepID=UPI00193E8840|nr:protein ALP1-like [Solenopsis invicta]
MSVKIKMHEWLVQCTHVMAEADRCDKLLGSLALLLAKKNKRDKKKKRFWVAPIFKKRYEHGFYHALLPTLRLEDLRFHNYFRMLTVQYEELLTIVGPHLERQYVVREPISAAERLTLTLRFLAAGDSMSSMTYQYLVGLTTVSNIIATTCQIIWEQLCPLVLPSQLLEDDWRSIAEDFEDIWDFPHCIGAIDGKHVIIQCPDNAGSNFYNYKNSHSIVLLAVCDANYIFRFVDIGAYGRRSDGGIFRESRFGQQFDAGKMNIPKPDRFYKGGPDLPYCIVGDEAFPLKSYLLRPYSGKNNLTAEQSIYNYRLSRARRVIENSFGILASQWRVYRKPIISSVETAMKIVQGMLDRETAEGDQVQGSWRTIMEDGCAFVDISKCSTNTSTRNAMLIRDEFCKYFNNEGAVAWQNDK